MPIAFDKISAYRNYVKKFQTVNFTSSLFLSYGQIIVNSEKSPLWNYQI